MCVIFSVNCGILGLRLIFVFLFLKFQGRLLTADSVKCDLPEAVSQAQQLQSSQQLQSQPQSQPQSQESFALAESMDPDTLRHLLKTHTSHCKPYHLDSSGAFRPMVVHNLLCSNELEENATFSNLQEVC